MKQFALAIVAVLAISPLAPGVAQARPHHYLTYKQARKAAKRRGHRVAHKNVRVSSLLRMGPRFYFAQVEWTRTDPYGCVSCGFDGYSFYDTPSKESCFADINVRRSARTGRIRTGLQDKACF